MEDISNIKDNNFITIQGWMRTQLNLSGNELIAMALIYGFSQDGESAFTGSMSYVADWIGVSRKTAERAVKSLVEKGYIKKIDVVRNNVKFCNYAVTDSVLNAKNGGWVKMTQGRSNCPRGLGQNDPGLVKMTQGGMDKMTHHIDRIHTDSINTYNTYIANSADATFADADKKESVDSTLVENENIYSGHSANYQSNLRKRGKNPRELGTNPRTVGLMDSLVDILGGCRTMERLGKLADWRNDNHTSQTDSDKLIGRAKSFDGTLDDFLNSLTNDKPETKSDILQQVIDIINPAQKITDARLRALNARLKDYSVDEVLAAAKRFAKDEWRNRPENKKFKSVDYLLAPSKFSRWAEMSDEDANEQPKSESISVKY